MTRTVPPVRPELADPLYYLRNFHFVIDWVEQRYSDLLAAPDRAQIATFRLLPEPAQALLVRMVMRKGEHFRVDRLNYAEIGATEQAAKPLLQTDLMRSNPSIDSSTLCHLLTVAELRGVAAQLSTADSEPPPVRKADLRDWLQRHSPDPRPWSDWWPKAPTELFELQVMPFCDRLRLMFFGNLRQEWSTFVLAELGLFRYETVSFEAASRPFSSALDIDTSLQLQRCRDRLEAGEPARVVLADVPADRPDSDWLTARRDRLLYQLAYQLERADDLEEAATLYRRIAAPGARQRLIRVLERQQQTAAALTLLEQALEEPESEAERQQVERMAKRLYRRAGRTPPLTAPASTGPEATLDLAPLGPRVELEVVDHLQSEAAPVYWVENALINSLLGLLCWPAIFAPLPGAFFHPYQSGPADLNRPDFLPRRRSQFEQALAALHSGAYRAIMTECWVTKHGLQNPFVHWNLLSRDLLDLALDCIPPADLEALFRRILFDIRANRSGLPDLVQFFPADKGYQLIEVKGPGDRLQDNQIRWLRFCQHQGIATRILYIRRP